MMSTMTDYPRTVAAEELRPGDVALIDGEDRVVYRVITSEGNVYVQILEDRDRYTLHAPRGTDVVISGNQLEEDGLRF